MTKQAKRSRLFIRSKEAITELIKDHQKQILVFPPLMLRVSLLIFESEVVLGIDHEVNVSIRTAENGFPV